MILANWILWDFISDVFYGLLLSAVLMIVGASWMHKSLRVNILLNALLSIFLVIIAFVQLSLFFAAGTLHGQITDIYELGQSIDIDQLVDSFEGSRHLVPISQAAIDGGLIKIEEIIDFVFWFRVRRMAWLFGAILLVAIIAIFKSHTSKATPLEFDSVSGSSSSSLNF